MTLELASQSPLPEFDGTDRGGPLQPLLTVENFSKHFPIHAGILNRKVASVRAVDDVSFFVLKGETLGVVGESGCGKSTLARLLMHLLPHDSGRVALDGDDVGERHGATLQELRRSIQMVFQDSASSLNPRLPIEESVAFGPRVRGTSKADAKQLTYELLERVGLNPRLFGGRYPHELSGGQKQRVNIARALALRPRLLILDEAVSALDKSVEAQVLNLLAELKEQFNLTYIFISHDLHVVRYISDRVMVMYLGQIVEIGPVDEIYQNPQHPYTKALLECQLSMDPDERVEAAPLAGDPPNPVNPPSGCRFHTRCPFAEDICIARAPLLGDVLGSEAQRHLAACHMTDAGSGHTRAAAFDAPSPATLSA
jgi:peptide/nickel transport system ATP-binding protein